MTQIYSNPTRESEPNALPDVEVFFHDGKHVELRDPEGEDMELGHYYWYCFPGCLPDTEPIGPFATEQEAIDDCREHTMVDAKDHVVPECACISCGKVMDRAFSNEGVRGPEEGDFTICIQCSTILVFKYDLTTRAATDEELKEIGGRSDLKSMFDAISLAKKER